MAALEGLRTRIVVLHRSGVGGGTGVGLVKELSKLLGQSVSRGLVRSSLAAENTQEPADLLSGRLTGGMVINNKVNNRVNRAWGVTDWVIPVPLVSVAEGYPDALRGATVWKVRVPQAGSRTCQQWQWQVLGVSDVTLTPLKSALADVLGDGFTLVSATAGGRFHPPSSEGIPAFRGGGNPILNLAARSAAASLRNVPNTARAQSGRTWFSM
ncbi:MAG: hypothetical protein JO362_02310 [Streptomycetaceae bacterium]|nr:hypothetical protein [Streptomycetaceae bacterium]